MHQCLPKEFVANIDAKFYREMESQSIESLPKRIRKIQLLRIQVQGVGYIYATESTNSRTLKKKK
jgi:ethanolamine utilization microcompartment shell protein EutL